MKPIQKDTAVCIAGGPSLTPDDVAYCKDKGAAIYAVKEVGLIAPWANVLYAADTDWWVKHPERWQAFKGEKWTCSERACQLFAALNHIGAKSDLIWSDNPDFLATGGNSGFQALNMAVLRGAERVILLGYDYGFDKTISDKHWWEEDYPRHSRWSNYAQWNKRMAAAADLITVPVLNASRQTTITCFPRDDIRNLL